MFSHKTLYIHSILCYTLHRIYKIRRDFLPSGLVRELPSIKNQVSHTVAL